MDSQIQLLSLTLYRRNCYSAHQNYFAYLSSLTEIKILKFTKKTQLQGTTSLAIPNQPVKGLSLKIQKQDNYTTIYTAILFITNYTIYINKQNYHTYSLTLDKNIVNFQNRFIDLSRLVYDRLQGFIFVTRNGSISTFNIQNKQIQIQTPANHNYIDSIASLAHNFPHVYLGTQNGHIKYIQYQQGYEQYKQVTSYDTTSKLPILNIVVAPAMKAVIATTCEGQIYILNKKLTKVSIISAHYCLISRIFVNNNILYTTGEDFILHKFQLLADRKTKLLHSQSTPKLVNLIVEINGKVFLSFYETLRLKQI